MRPKKLTTVLENLISEIDCVYTDYIESKQKLDTNIRNWVSNYVNDIEHRIIDVSVKIGEHWRFKGLSYPLLLQEEDLYVRIQTIQNECDSKIHSQQTELNNITGLTATIEHLKSLSVQLDSKKENILSQISIRHLQEWDTLIETYKRIEEKDKTWFKLSLPLKGNILKKTAELYTNGINKILRRRNSNFYTSKQFIDWNNQLIKMKNLDIQSIDSRKITKHNLFDLFVINSHVVETYNQLISEHNKLDIELEDLIQKLQLKNKEYKEISSELDIMGSELESLLARKSRLSVIKENDELYSDSKSRAVTVITSYIVQEYERSLEWLKNEGASEIVSDIETMMLLAQKFNILDAARRKLEAEIEEGSNVSIIQTAIKEKDILSTAMYLTNNELKLSINS